MKAIVVALVVACTGVAVFALLDVSAEAEPGWIERTLAFRVLEARIALAGAPHAPPSDTSDERSAGLYRQRCAFCHGGVDGTAAQFARTLSPRPPQFLVDRPRASIAVDAYIIKHGVRWTGMPAFRSMSDVDAWRLASYVHRVRKDTVLDPLAGLRPYLAGVMVPDADQAAQWYHDNLGFTEDGASTVNGLRQVVMERGTYAIELLSTNDRHALGFSKLGFYVDDLVPVLAELRARHVPIVRDLTTLTQFQIRFALIHDANGNTIQLFDRLSPGKRDSASANH